MVDYSIPYFAQIGGVQAGARNPKPCSRSSFKMVTDCQVSLQGCDKQRGFNSPAIKLDKPAWLASLESLEPVDIVACLHSNQSGSLDIPPLSCSADHPLPTNTPARSNLPCPVQGLINSLLRLRFGRGRPAVTNRLLNNCMLPAAPELGQRR